MNVVDVEKAFEEWILTGAPKKLTRQQEKVRELGAVTTVCLDKEHGKTTQDFYRCLKTQATKLA